MNKLSRKKKQEVDEFMTKNNFSLLCPSWYRGYYPYWSDKILVNNNTNLATVFEFVYDNQGGSGIDHFAAFYNHLHRILI